jgi:hypothetical protein
VIHRSPLSDLVLLIADLAFPPAQLAAIERLLSVPRTWLMSARATGCS